MKPGPTADLCAAALLAEEKKYDDEAHAFCFLVAEALSLVIARLSAEK